jgi:hypothetical protein
MSKKTAIVEIRGQHAKGTWPAQGPDTYVAVQIVPEGVEPLVVLNRRNAKLRGIEIVYCGEGYRNRTGSRSMYGRAVEEAERIAAEING